MTRLALLCFTTLLVCLSAPVSAQTTPAPAPASTPVAQPNADKQRALLLPLRLSSNASQAVRSSAPVVEQALQHALDRHGVFHLLSKQEVQQLATRAMQDQLMGCDAESCMAEVADALGASFLIMAQLDQVGGLWEFSGSVLERQKARVVRRASVRARNLDAVLESVDQVARQLCGGSKVALDDPKLMERLATNEAGRDALKQAAAATPEADVSTLWTNVVVDHNAESEALALTEGGLVLGAGVVLVLGTMLGTPMSNYASTAAVIMGPDGDFYRGGNPPTPGGYTFPGLLLLVSYLPGILAAGLAGVLLLAAVAVGAVDMMDRGRLVVGRRGCCRDEARIRAAEKPGWGRRVAPFVAAAGGAAALLVPVFTFLVSLPVSLLLTPITQSGRFVVGPGPVVDSGTYRLLYGIVVGTLGVVGVGALAALGAAGFGAALLLIASENPPVLDPDPPVAIPKPAAAPPSPGAGAAPPPPAAETPPAETLQPDPGASDATPTP